MALIHQNETVHVFSPATRPYGPDHEVAIGSVRSDSQLFEKFVRLRIPATRDPVAQICWRFEDMYMITES